jgi:hypothetical protein
LRRLGRRELEGIRRDLDVLRSQARQVSEELDVDYYEALILLTLRELVLLRDRVVQCLQAQRAEETSTLDTTVQG